MSTTQAAPTVSTGRPDLAAAGAMTGALTIAFSTSPVVLNPSLPFALLALLLCLAPRRATGMHRSWRRILTAAGLVLSATAAATVLGLHT